MCYIIIARLKIFNLTARRQIVNFFFRGLCISRMGSRFPITVLILRGCYLSITCGDFEIIFWFVPAKSLNYASCEHYTVCMYIQYVCTDICLFVCLYVCLSVAAWWDGLCSGILLFPECPATCVHHVA